MLRIFNSLSKKIEPFQPLSEAAITVFTCGPSVYQSAHIGNFRTFLFEDVLIRYLEYSGHTVERGMNITDLEDKAIREAAKRHMSLRELADKNLRHFQEEMTGLRMKTPDYLPRASESIEEAVAIIERLLDRKIAYWHGKNVYFDPLKSPDFGRIYGLDLSKWPTKKRRFHQDTYPGVQWNLGDFILWHGCKDGDSVCWDSRLGRGRPSWNIQDPSMISKHYDEPLSIYCGGFDNLYRHHDYTRAILESVRPYDAAKYWLHCHHLVVDGKKMSKSRGNICYLDTLLAQGYDAGEVRFFLIYGHYRCKLNFSEKRMHRIVEKLRAFRDKVRSIQGKADPSHARDTAVARRVRDAFLDNMDNDLNVKGAVDGIYGLLRKVDADQLIPGEAAAIVWTLRGIDRVLKVIF